MDSLLECVFVQTVYLMRYCLNHVVNIILFIISFFSHSFKYIAQLSSLIMYGPCLYIILTGPVNLICVIIKCYIIMQNITLEYCSLYNINISE